MSAWMKERQASFAWSCTVDQTTPHPLVLTVAMISRLICYSHSVNGIAEVPKVNELLKITEKVLGLPFELVSLNSKLCGLFTEHTVIQMVMNPSDEFHHL